MSFNKLISIIKNDHNIGEIKTILDIGSRDLCESIRFTKEFPFASIHAFECNPNTLDLCREREKQYENIFLHELCVFDYDGTIIFRPIDQEKTITKWKDGNPGASSVFKSNGAFDNIEKYVQTTTEVPCTRLDTWAKLQNISSIDLIWMDLQGSELQALKGLGELLKSVKVIHTEAEISPMYENQSLFKDIDPYIKSYGFDRIWGNTKARFGTDFIYLRSR